MPLPRIKLRAMCIRGSLISEPGATTQLLSTSLISKTRHCSVSTIVFRARYPAFRAINCNANDMSACYIYSSDILSKYQSKQFIVTLSCQNFTTNPNTLCFRSLTILSKSTALVTFFKLIIWPVCLLFSAVRGVGWEGIYVASGRTSWHMRRWPIYQFRIQRGRMVNERHGQSCLLTCTVNSLLINHQPRLWRSPHRDPAKPMSLSTRAETCYRRVINH